MRPYRESISEDILVMHLILAAVLRRNRGRREVRVGVWHPIFLVGKYKK